MPSSETEDAGASSWLASDLDRVGAFSFSSTCRGVLGFPAIFFGIDHAMYIFDYIALGAALASAVSLFAAFVFGALPLP
jgi:hypothetical protein